MAAFPVELTSGFNSGQSKAFKSMGPTFWLGVFGRDCVGDFLESMSMWEVKIRGCVW